MPIIVGSETHEIIEEMISDLEETIPKQSNHRDILEKLKDDFYESLTLNPGQVSRLRKLYVNWCK